MDCKRSSNGRVNIVVPAVENRFNLTDRIPVSRSTDYRDATAGSWYSTCLSQKFFGAENITKLQKGMIEGVFKRSNGKFRIGMQNQDTLKIIMRSIFLTESKNLPNGVPQQIASLNKQVLDYCVPQIVGEAVGYVNYCRDASTLSVPMSAPINVARPDRQLQPNPWLMPPGS